MSPRRLAPISALALAVALTAVVTGCGAGSAETGNAAAPASPATSTGAPQGQSTASATPTATALDPDNYTCETILPPTTLAVFAGQEKDGFTLQDDFAERSRAFGSDLVYFVDYNGILCQWGYPSGTEPIDYGFSAITAANATERIARLSEGGFVETDDPRGTLLINADTESFPGSYLFLDDYWLYASQPDMLDLIAANLPEL
jgi:hypothetical protein